MLGRILGRRRSRRVPKLTTAGVCRSGELNRLLERERARADRTGHELSFVLIGIDSRLSKTASVQMLLEVIHSRSRITDDAGIFDGRTAYVLLPDTLTQGAGQFAKTIQAVMARRGMKLSYAIYTYAPANVSRRKPPRNGGGPGGGGGGRLDDALPAVARRLHDGEPSKPSVSVAMADPGRPARALDHAMLRRLPLWKRAMDVGVAGGMLLVLWPVMVTIGLAVKLESRGPALFHQRRAGLGGKPFQIVKFRTMINGAERTRDYLLHINEQDGPAFKIRNDPRITRVGKFLRKTSLDELPQLINILRGEMTLVGPRPLPCHESDICVGWQRRRLNVVPGLTCIWQVSGRSTVSFDDWMRMDLAYQKRHSLWQDLRLICATIPAVLTQRGAH